MSSSEDFFVRLEQLNEAGAALSRVLCPSKFRERHAPTS